MAQLADAGQIMWVRRSPESRYITNNNNRSMEAARSPFLAKAETVSPKAIAASPANGGIPTGRDRC